MERLPLQAVHFNSVELDEPSIEFKPVKDERPPMPLPPPVRLVSVEDVRLEAATGQETKLDAFYVHLLKFEREESPPGTIRYRSENFRLIFAIVEPPILRDTVRPIGIDVPSLQVLEQGLIEREMEYSWLRGLLPGMEALFFTDPAGNWVQVGQFSLV